MSCNYNSGLIQKASGLVGLSALNSRFSYLSGLISSQASDLAQQLGPATSRLASEIDRTIDRVGQVQGQVAAALLDGSTGTAKLKQVLDPAAAVGVKMAAALFPPARTAAKVIKITERLSSLAGNVAGALSQTAEAGQVIQEKRTFLLFKSKTPVALWKSNLTSLLNRGDVIGASRFSGRNVVASDGVMFQSGGKTWHQGTIVVKLPQGQRTISHLQSLSLPANHYYFDRPLSNEQAVGLAGGQLKPETVAGFVGQVSPTEALCPVWAESKQALILARLYWPPERRRAEGGRMKDEGGRMRDEG